jgi:hypothetical protein
MKGSFMSRPIVQAVRFKESGDELFDTYLHPGKHSEKLGKGAVVVSPEVGAEFSAFDGGLRGKNIVIVPKRLIVQSWRASTDKWPESEGDSLLILAFCNDAVGGRIDLVHLNVPDAAFEQINDGWKKHYWGPWRGELV